MAARLAPQTSAAPSRLAAGERDLLGNTAGGTDVAAQRMGIRSCSVLPRNSQGSALSFLSALLHACAQKVTTGLSVTPFSLSSKAWLMSSKA